MPSTTDAPRRFHFGSLLGLGVVTDFLDTLGVGSFATTGVSSRPAGWNFALEANDSNQEYLSAWHRLLLFRSTVSCNPEANQ